jgi:hypothetical protein
MKTFTSEEVAEMVSNDNHNPEMKRGLELYLQVVERSGFKFFKEESEPHQEAQAKA